MKSGGTSGFSDVVTFEQKPGRGGHCMSIWGKSFLGGGGGQAKCKVLNIKHTGTGSPVIKGGVKGGGRKREKSRMSSKVFTRATCEL